MSNEKLDHPAIKAVGILVEGTQTIVLEDD